MEAPYIKAELRVRGYTLRKLASRMKVSEGCVWRIVHGRASSRRIAKEVSLITGISVSELWPGRYPDLELAEIRAGRAAA
ncbi:helix-turn-helix domain-containing protein [Algiphilus sp.]|uniref:helix-turn-helix domain-containing protein n=1 Tax=Algiphilus sp. TaxID=1872431 RepID=UPI003C5EA6CA